MLASPSRPEPEAEVAFLRERVQRLTSEVESTRRDRVDSWAREEEAQLLAATAAAQLRAALSELQDARSVQTQATPPPPPPTLSPPPPPPQAAKRPTLSPTRPPPRPAPPKSPAADGAPDLCTLWRDADLARREWDDALADLRAAVEEANAAPA
eukprot:TRINITY_DN6091_c2_g1_i1.p3 TRINITY_DN6091_c2_g1~~TRINITY_DN6091_c2_g1_i1.p3  ORF type:complete len:154 (+),score=65.02 TRINITY_DN6091_c2_g1_i1:721-1182(+)